ncbi:hypothetical protein X769_32285 [Mesorhizobium sp. LSJC268A00]|nr:hypothetical protein X769_32285 [Mesorhizobium sp. LSJC268A00]ESY31660.1 hypothetical protein X749_09510 [Mesorhizobium sp. LNJC391B00]ESZ51769.1 hypothetical protein X729_32620 [Mesorhizobium sp. L103C131B0]
MTWGIFGDVEADVVGSKLSCRRCGRNDHMQAETPVAVSAFQADVLCIPRPGERYGCA